MSKTSFIRMAQAINGTRQIAGGLLLAAFAFHSNAHAAQVTLGSDTAFAVLAGSGITVAGAANSSAITGNIGTSPTLSVTGLGNVTLTGVNETANSGLMLTAKNDLTTAFNNAALAPATTSYATIQDLGGLTLLPGVYNEPSSFGLTGILKLDANGDPNAVWIFQAGTTLVTASSSEVELIDGAQADDVFWDIGTSATLGSSSEFDGNILAAASITAGSGVTVDGRLLAENGAVTLDGSDTIGVPTQTISPTNPPPSVPDNGNTLLLLGCVAVTLFAFRQHFTLSPYRMASAIGY